MYKRQVKDSVGKGKAQLVLCAGDLSEGTRRRVGAFCEDWVAAVSFLHTADLFLWIIQMYRNFYYSCRER